jgi:hypothetical protein
MKQAPEYYKWKMRVKTTKNRKKNQVKTAFTCMIVSALFGAAPAFGAAPVEAPPKAPEMIARWQDANNRCRGGSGDDTETWVACGQRDVWDEMLKRSGYCYGKRGEAGHRMKWHVCTPSSVR